MDYLPEWSNQRINRNGARPSSTGKQGGYQKPKPASQNQPQPYGVCSPIYSPLDPSRREIRLLTAYGFTNNAILSTTLETVSLNDSPDFLALSYVWGVRGRRSYQMADKILVNGTLLTVTPNLRAAIVSLYDETGTHPPLRIWADAICINQRDCNEKAWQVDLMADIYKQASSTVIWLGRFHTRPLGKALAFVDRLTRAQFLDQMKALEELEALEKPVEIQPRGRKAVARSGRSTGTTPLRVHNPSKVFKKRRARDFPHTLLPPSSFQKLLISLRELLRDPWWGRRWVVQEAFFSRNPLVSDGTAVVAMDKFANLACWHAAYLRTSHRVPAAVKTLFDDCPFYPLLRCWTAYRRDPSVHRAALPRWMALTARFRQSLARDMVFGLLSLAAARDQINIKPDYHSSDEEIFGRVYAHLIQAYGFECLRANFAVGKPDLRLPSWCGRWSGNEGRLVMFAAEPGKPAFNACGSSSQVSRFVNGGPAGSIDSPNRSNPGLLSSFGEILAIRGYEFDEVAVVIPTSLCIDSLGDSSLRSIEEQFRTAVDDWKQRLCFFKDDPYENSCGRTMAACLTLLGNRIGAIPDREWVGKFAAWKRKDEIVQQPMGRRLDTDRLPQVQPTRSIREDGEDPFYEKARLLCHNRSLIITTRGFVALGPLKTKDGDVVSIFHGSAVPLILRKDEISGLYDLLGEAYVHGIMYGEASAASLINGSDVEFFIR